MSNATYSREVTLNIRIRSQQEGESVETFITHLHCLAEQCEFGVFKDEHIRDRIVVGLKDKKLSEKLPLDPKVTLEKAVTKARQSEAVKKQQGILQGTQLDPPQPMWIRFRRKGAKELKGRIRRISHPETLR